MSVSDGSSEDFDTRDTNSSSGVSMGSVGHATTEARVLKRLPKRIRLDLGNKTSTGSVVPSLNSTPLGISGSGQQLQRGLLHSDAESTPALDSPDTTSAENDEELLPSTPPELSANSLHQAHYQPLFAPVDHIVKQAALGTTLFGPAVQVYNKPNNTAPLAHDRSPTPVLPTATDDAEGEDHIEHYQVAQKEASQAKVSNTKKRKVPNQLVPTDRSLVSDPEDSDDPAEEATPSPEHATSVLQDTTAEGLAFRSKLSRRAYTSVKSRTPAHQHIMKAALAPQGGKDHSWSTTADDDDASQRKSKKSIKHAKVKLSDDLDANQHPRAPPWARAAAADAAWPEFILPHLWDPELGPLYPFDEMYAQEEERSAYRAAQKAIKPEPLPPEMVLDTFAFHVPLPSILTSRIEDLRNEKERQQLAKELAIERERLRAKEAELLSLKRREMAASHAAGEMPKEYTVGGMQTEADPSLTSGTVIYASKWSTSGPPMDPSSSSKSRKGGAKGDSTKKSAPSSKKKKKKRAAHANANNHHHRDNYVPSRQPRSTPQTPAQATIVPSMHDMPSLGLVSDDNIFSTASFHPQLGYTNLTPFFVGQDEWLCSWCEMALLFGDDDAKTQQLIKKRKNALKVRKKAQRRAAKAAAGELPAKDSKKKKGKASTNTSTTNSAPAQGPARKCASVQTVPEGEDPHAPPPTPETSDSPPLTHEDDEGDEEDDIDSDQAEVGTSDDEEDVDAETSSR